MGHSPSTAYWVVLFARYCYLSSMLRKRWIPFVHLHGPFGLLWSLDSLLPIMPNRHKYAGLIGFLCRSPARLNADARGISDGICFIVVTDLLAFFTSCGLKTNVHSWRAVRPNSRSLTSIWYWGPSLVISASAFQGINSWLNKMNNTISSRFCFW